MNATALPALGIPPSQAAPAPPALNVLAPKQTLEPTDPSGNVTTAFGYSKPATPVALVVRERAALLAPATESVMPIKLLVQLQRATPVNTVVTVVVFILVQVLAGLAARKPPKIAADK